MENTEILEQILVELKKQNEYFDRMDWKLWMIQNMFEGISKANGYEFTFEETDATETFETIEEPEQSSNSNLRPKYDDTNWSLE